MLRPPILFVLVAFLVFTGHSNAAELHLATATGTIEKVGKESLTIQPRHAGGKFGKSLVLKLTGTSKLSSVGTRMQGKKLIPVQRDAEARDFKRNQTIAIIYTTIGKDEHVLLAAVVLPGGGK